MLEVFNDDCLKILKKFDDESIDLVITDCPYRVVSGGCKKGRFKLTGGMLDHEKTDGTLVKKGKLFTHNDIKFSEWLPDVYRVLKEGSHCYIMINSRNLKELQEEAEKVGFKFQNLLIWNKGNATPNRYYMQAFECILMLRKGPAKSIKNMGTTNLLNIPNIRGKAHPTEKPVELMEVFVLNSSDAGDKILDPFMGVGGTGIAALKHGRKFVGIEIDERYYDKAVERIKEVIKEA